MGSAKSKLQMPSEQEPIADDGETPSFFRIDSSPRPTTDDIAVRLTEDEGARADRADLDSLLGPPGGAPRRAVDDMLLRLDSGLFAGTKPALLAPLPDLTAPVKPSAPDPGFDRGLVPPVPAPTETETPTARALAAPFLVMSGRPLTGGRHSGMLGWGAAAVTATAVLSVAAWRFGDAAAPRSAPPPPHSALPLPRAPEARELPTPPTAAPLPEPVPSPARPQPSTREAIAGPKPPAASPPPPPPARPAPAAVVAEFDRAAAKASLTAAAAVASRCKHADEAAGGGRVSVTFAPTGRVTTTRLVSGPLQSTPTGSCMVRAFRSVSVPPFSGDPVTVTKDVSIR